MTGRLTLAAALLACVLPGVAESARFGLVLAPGTDPADVAQVVIQRTGNAPESLAPMRSLLVEAPRRSALERIPGVVSIERLSARRLAFVPNDPLVSRQWYVPATRAFDAWELLPKLAGVRVAVIDSGIDGGHPELAGRVAAARSFVSGPPRVDVLGHGTFVAGLIAAETDNETGIAGLAPSAELIVAKVVTPDRTIPVEAEVRAIRWAVESGARIVNMSLGGLRHPLDPEADTYSSLEAEAVRFAVSRGVLVVAAVGNGDQAPRQPWGFASYPAALPHVLGVSAVARDGSVPGFSNRDAVYNDIAAPGEGILSTFPRPLTAQRPTCAEQGYSSCAVDEFRNGEGTSFAAPLVTAAAASLLGTRPQLRPEQVSAVLQRTAVDANASNGCRLCPLHRDALSGWGRLDITAALAALSGPLPEPDRFEANDDAGGQAYPLYGKKRNLRATVDFWDDQDDVYRVHLRRGERLSARLTGPRGLDLTLALWPPGTREVTSLGGQARRLRLSARPGASERLSYQAAVEGNHYVQVRLTSQGAGAYRLALVKRR